MPPAVCFSALVKPARTDPDPPVGCFRAKFHSCLEACAPNVLYHARSCRSAILGVGVAGDGSAGLIPLFTPLPAGDPCCKGVAPSLRPSPTLRNCSPTPPVSGTRCFEGRVLYGQGTTRRCLDVCCVKKGLPGQVERSCHGVVRTPGGCARGACRRWQHWSLRAWGHCLSSVFKMHVYV
jgi:hypothetical protein